MPPQAFEQAAGVEFDQSSSALTRSKTIEDINGSVGKDELEIIPTEDGPDVSEDIQVMLSDYESTNNGPILTEDAEENPVLVGLFEKIQSQQVLKQRDFNI